MLEGSVLLSGSLNWNDSIRLGDSLLFLGTVVAVGSLDYFGSAPFLGSFSILGPRPGKNSVMCWHMTENTALGSVSRPIGSARIIKPGNRNGH